ncbi:MAG: glycosyltransferase [Bacteroidales bacterium]|nr:glycosyltransferase [Bacteroidales bacterium]
MKILQTIQGMATSSGGPSTCTNDMLEGLSICCQGTDTEIELLTFDSQDENTPNLGKGSKWMKELKYDCWSPLSLSNGLARFLSVSDYDIYHTNALWMYINHLTCKAARQKNKPYLISPHGMLYPTALNMKYWKKWPMLKLWFEKDIHSATCLHATCQQEMEHCRAFGYKGPIAVIPNCVVIPDGIDANSVKSDNCSIGFLGRLHPIKKVENLLYAVSKAIESGCSPLRVEIMGKGDDSYEQFLRNEVLRLGIEENVCFTGFITGKEKYKHLSRLWGLFVPSVQENFGMIVPEALLCGTPVYASLGTPWSELDKYGCGWWNENSPEVICSIILELFSKSKNDIMEMGARGRRLIEDKYEQHKVAHMMLQLYTWINGTGLKPDFVYE